MRRISTGSVVLLALVTLFPLGDAGCLIQPQDSDCTGVPDCDTCSGRSGCGWCVGTRRCVPGTSLGPTSGVCAQWRFAVCEVADPNNCTRNTTCGTCTILSSDSCGWCAGENRCKPVTGGMAPDGCTGTLVTSYDACTAPTPSRCTAFSSCRSCSGDSVCIWCINDGACRESSSLCHGSAAIVPSECP